MMVKPTAGGENKKAMVPVSSTEANNASLQRPDMFSSRKASAYPQKEAAPRFARGGFQGSVTIGPSPDTGIGLDGRPFSASVAYPRGSLWRPTRYWKLDRTLEPSFLFQTAILQGIFAAWFDIKVRGRSLANHICISPHVFEGSILRCRKTLAIPRARPGYTRSLHFDLTNA